MLLNFVGLGALLAGAPAILLFVFFYWTRSNWRKYPVGRALMYFAISLGTTYVWIIVRLVISLAGHDTENLLAWQIVRITLFTAISATLWRLTYMLLKIQRARGTDWTIREAEAHNVDPTAPPTQAG